MLVVIAALTALLAIGIGYQIVQNAADVPRFPPPGQLVEIAPGRRLHVDCRGAGEPVVILEAGIAASSLSWSRVQPRVAEFTRVCTYDRAGLAWSEPADPPYTAMHMADQLHALLTAIRLPRRYVLVGHSFGGFVVQAFASKYRDEVAGLVLVDTIYPAEWTAMTPQQRFRLRGGVFLSRIGGLLARVGLVRACLSLLARGSTGVRIRISDTTSCSTGASSCARRLAGRTGSSGRESHACWVSTPSAKALAACSIRAPASTCLPATRSNQMQRSCRTSAGTQRRLRCSGSS